MALMTAFPEPDYENGCKCCGGPFPKYTSNVRSGKFCYNCIDAINAGATPNHGSSSFRSGVQVAEEARHRNYMWKTLGY